MASLENIASIISKIKKRTRENWILLSILGLGALLRLYSLNSNPAAVFTDELLPFASTLGLMQHGGPYYSTTLFSPVNLIVVSLFGEWESILLIGSNTIAIRLPGAVYGIILILLVYILSRSMFNREIALWASFLIALSPFAIQASRVFYMTQSVDSLFFLLLAVILFKKGANAKNGSSKYIGVSSFIFGLTIGFYFTAYGRVTSMLIFVMLILRVQSDNALKFKEETRKLHAENRHIKREFRRSVFLTGVLPILISLIPLILLPSFTISGITQSLTGNAKYFSPDTNLLLNLNLKDKLIFLERYLDYFGPNFLFISGDPNPSQNTGLTGEMLYPSLFFFYFGILVIIFDLLFLKRHKRFDLLLIFFWIFSAPIEVSAFVLNTYTDSSGSVFLMPMLQIISALGIYYSIKYLLSILDKKKHRPEYSIDLHNEQHFSSYFRTMLKKMSTRKLKSVILVVIVVSSYTASEGVFLYDYYVIHQKNTLNQADSQWGEIYGFPQMTNFIISHNLTKYPIFITPSGLFGGKYSTFKYFYYNLKIPQGYFYYYSHGKYNPDIPIINVSYFYPTSKSLLISGSNSNLEILNASGVLANMIYSIYRPNGSLALSLIMLTPGISKGAQDQLNNTVFSAFNITKPSIINSNENLSNLSNFTISMLFDFPAKNYTENRFYSLFYNGNSSSPSCGFRISTMSYQPGGGSNNVMTFNTFIYGEYRNSSYPSSLIQIWSHREIYPSIIYLVTLELSKGSYQVFLNGTLSNIGTLELPFKPLSSFFSFDQNLNATVFSLSVWNTPLSAAQISYFYLLEKNSLYS